MPDLKTLILVVATAFSVFFFSEARYSPAALSLDVEQVAFRLDQKIISDQLASTQARIWALQDRYPSGNMPQVVLEEYRALLERKKKLQEKLKSGV